MVNNLTNLTGTKTFYDLILFDNSVTNGLLSTGFLITVFIILTFMFMRRYDIEESILVSSFLCTMVGLGMASISLMPFGYFITFAAMTVVLGVWVFFKNKSGA